jgi:uncharacterized RDD family membrane protein YckC
VLGSLAAAAANANNWDVQSARVKRPRSSRGISVENRVPQLDTRIEIVTPENIAFQYCLAGPFRRLPAYLLDMAIRIGVCGLLCVFWLVAFGSLGFSGWGVGLVFITWFLIDWFYGGLFETFWNGQTPGKRLLQIRVVSVEGQPITGLQAVLRNFLRFLDSLPFLLGQASLFPLYQLGLLTAAANDRFQRLGDLASGTMVVVEEASRQYGVVRVTDPAALELAGRLPTSFVASRSLARALSAYVARRATFPFRRRIEIAFHLADPLRHRLGLPPDTNPDLLLCALYHRTFIADRVEAEAVERKPRGARPRVAAAG